MITIRPVKRALVPVDSAAATRVSGPNYDEFQGDQEIFDLLQRNPDSILRVTMAHCAVDSPEKIGVEGSDEALDQSAAHLIELIESPLARVVENVLYVYEITDPARGGIRQIGLGGSAATSEIRTEDQPDGTLIRNEGIREEKAKGRADLISRTKSTIGTVNMAVDDDDGKVAKTLESIADSREVSFEALDEQGRTHKIWLITESAEIDSLVQLFASLPCAYVADGNHRSAAAAMLGHEDFLCVFFTVDRMGLAPYNRLVAKTGKEPADLAAALSEHFEVTSLGAVDPVQPSDVHDIAIYQKGEWLRLVPKASAYDAANAAESIDSDIVQRQFFGSLLGITDPKDKALRFVGGNKDAAYLQAEVDSGDYAYAVVLAPVDMRQFVDVCKQDRFMPPKSTWFEPKIRSGLVTALLD